MDRMEYLSANIDLHLGQAQSPPPAPPANDRSDVLVDVRRLLQIREAQAITTPDDAVNSGQISALRNLETVSRAAQFLRLRLG